MEGGLLLSMAELRELTGGLALPRCQLRVLRERGFHRARLERGRLVLERAHYDAVCRASFTTTPGLQDNARPHPQLRRVK